MEAAPPSEFCLTVHLHTILERRTPTGRQSQVQVWLAPGATLADLLSLLEIQIPLDALLLVVNGRVCEAGQVIRPGDKVELIPALEGG
jgi:sulfur carrier protein ThiS